MQSAPQKIDYSRCPLWWWRVVITSGLTGREVHRTFVRAADYEAAKCRAGVVAWDCFGFNILGVAVTPMLNRSGLSRGAQEFAGYGDE